MADRHLVDTSVLLHARGRDHPLRAPCQRVIEGAIAGDLTLEASVEVVQEYLHVRLRRPGPRAAALEEADEVRALCRLHPFDIDVMDLARELLGHHDVSVRDAIHAATAIHAGGLPILSTDSDFDRIDGVRRLDPRDLA